MSDNQNEARDLSEVLRELAETSSMHGIPKIVSSRQLPIKILWFLLVIATTSLTGYQIVNLVTEFRSNSVITKLRMGFSRQNLPDITFCNMNPVRRSKTHIFPSDIQESIFTEESDVTYPSIENKWIQLWSQIKIALKILPTSEVMKVGHKMEDIMVSSKFADEPLVLNGSNVAYFTAADYGNCFKIHSLDKKVMRSGPDYGLKLVLNLEQSEYIHELASGMGLRLVLSEPGTFAMPSEEGITISGGFDTNIGLRTVRISRTGEPFSHCTDGEQFYKQYGRKYSVNSKVLMPDVCAKNRTSLEAACQQHRNGTFNPSTEDDPTEVISISSDSAEEISSVSGDDDDISIVVISSVSGDDDDISIVDISSVSGDDDDISIVDISSVSSAGDNSDGIFYYMMSLTWTGIPNRHL